MSIQALREQRDSKAKALHALASKEGDFTAADRDTYDAGMAELADIDARIKRINDANALIANAAIEDHVIVAADRAAKDTGSSESAMFAKWLRGGDTALTAEEWGKVRAALSEGTNTAGGYTVQTDVASSVLDALKAFGGMRSVADVFTTAQGNPIQFPTSDGTAEVGEIVAENTAATALDTTFGIKTLPVYKFSSKVITVPWELLQDSSVDIEAFVRGRLVTRLGRITNTKYTLGTGTSEPTGIVTAAPVGVTGATGSTTSVSYDNLVALQHSVDPAYRALGNTGWMLNDDTLRAIRLVKDGQGRPIFVPGYSMALPTGGPAAGIPDTLLGRPVTVNQDVAVMAASAASILFGDFSFYKIRDVMQVEMFRFTDSTYTKSGQVGFLAWMRSGGNLIDVGGAVKAYKNSAT